MNSTESTHTHGESGQNRKVTKFPFETKMLIFILNFVNFVALLSPIVLLARLCGFVEFFSLQIHLTQFSFTENQLLG
jgi:hypothetical protein